MGLCAIRESLKHGTIAFKHIGNSWGENGIGVLMDKRELGAHPKGSHTVDYVNMWVDSRLREAVNLHLISPCYAASRILHPVFRSLVQKLCLQPGGGSGKATEMETCPLRRV